MSGKRAKRERRRRSSFGRHEPVRVMTEQELLSSLAELESSPVGTSFLVVGLSDLPAAARGAQRPGAAGVE